MNNIYQINCKSIITTDDDEFSDVSMSKISKDCVEIYPDVCKTISLSLEELEGIVAEIKAFKAGK